VKAVSVNPLWAQGEAGHSPFLDTDLPVPQIGPRDLLVRVFALGLNPIDLKMRLARIPANSFRIVGWDVSGVVEAVGTQVTRFKPGDEVYYAGSVLRTGAACELHAVDERLVGHKPVSLSHAAAAALPLATLAAWEALFERMRLPVLPTQPSAKCLMILGAAGGVGTVAIQLAARIARYEVVATSSHSEGAAHCERYGASYVLNHARPLKPQIDALGLPPLPYVLCLADPGLWLGSLAEAMAPFGHMCCLSEASVDLPMNTLRSKSLTFSWEGMFTRAIYTTPDMSEQGQILDRMAMLVNDGVIRSPLGRVLGPVDAATMQLGHELLGQGQTVGKFVLEN
jgi:NADPH2:quinone reductase